MQTQTLIIYHNEKELCRAEKWTFYDKAQSVGSQYISTSIKSSVPIMFHIGDYCEYRGERYYLNNLPSVTQQASPKQYGEGFVYENVRFDGESFELCRIIMLDITPTTGLYIPKKGTNYTGSSNFQLYCAETRMNINGKEQIYPAVCTLAGKIQANLDRAYPKLGWNIKVDTTSTHEVNGRVELRTHTESQVISFNGTTVANALAEVANTFKLNFHIKGRTIYIGYTLGAITGHFDGDKGLLNDNDYFYLGYGQGYADKDNIGRGLYEIKREAESNQQIITRLRAMGSTKNLPYRYYNKRYDLSQSLFPLNLQLPDTFKTPSEKHLGHQRRLKINNDIYEVLGETNDAYLDKYNDVSKCEEGLREGVAVWDGSNKDLPEIYPTIENMTYGELRGNNCPDMLGYTEDGKSTKIDGHSSFYYYENKERVDEILAVGKLMGSTLKDDANFGNGILQPNQLDYSANINCPCNVLGLLSFSRSEYELSHIYEEYPLFPPIKNQPAGRYILTPISTSLRAEFSIDIEGYGEDKGKVVGSCFYEINLYSISVKDKKRTTIGKYTSKEKEVSSEKPCAIDLPALPDLFDDKRDEDEKFKAQIKEIRLDSASDVYATITFNVMFLKVDTNNSIRLNFYAGKSQTGKEGEVMKDTPSVYIWAPTVEDKEDVNKPFHVIIKDIGIDKFVSQFNGKEQAVLSIKDGNCLAREFAIGKDVKKVTYKKNNKIYNGWQLELTRATDDSIHRYYPNSIDTLQSGDHYVLLGIPMPDAYVQAAEMRLLVAASQYLKDNCTTKYNYEPKIDNIYLARNYDKCVKELSKEQSIYWNLYAGLRFPFAGSPSTNREYEALPLINIPIDSLTIKEGEGVIPTVEIHLKEGNIQSSIQQINTKIDNLYDGLNRGSWGMNFNDINTAIMQLGNHRFLRKDTADTAADFITFLRGLIAKQTSYFDAINTKDLTVTGKATFFELEILKAKAAGGIVIQSAATFKIDYVEDTKDGYVCYQRAEMDGVKLIQQCEQGDQMLCYGGMNVNERSKVSNHFFWCLVTAAPKATIKKQFDTVSREYLQLTLSKTDHATGSDAPQVGDVMMLVGNRTNTDRQSVNISSVYKSIDKGLKPPYWAKYTDVNDYDLSSHRETYFSRGDNQIIGNLSAKSPSGVIKPVVVFLGRWNADTSYGYYDSVTHNGRQWLCIIEKGKKTQDEPGTTDAWQIIVDKGDKGDSPIMVNILSSTGNIMRNGQGEVTLTAIVTQDGEDITDKYPQAAFSWTRTSSNPEYDVQWNKRHRATGKTITIKAEDVWKKAQFEVILNN